MSEDHTSALGKVWDPDTALESLKEEATVREVDLTDPGQVEDAVNQLFREHALVMAMGVVHTGLYELNPKTRFEAAKFVLERAAATGEGDADPLGKLLKEIYEHADATSGDGG